MLSANGTTPLGDMVYTHRWLGSQGWNTGGAASRDGLWHMIWFDVTPHFARRLTVDEEYQPLVVPGKISPTAYGYNPPQPIIPGDTSGGWHGGFGGPDATVAYITLNNGVYVSSDFLTGRNFTQVLTGKPVDANQQTTSRTWAGKGATDPINADVYYINLAGHGTFRTLDRGVSFAKVPGLPDPAPITHPADPYCRWAIIAVDETGPNTAGLTARKARVAMCPNGQGVWLSTDGTDTSTKISTASGPGKIDSVCSMTWINGKLVVTVVNANTFDYGPVTSGATGGSGSATTGKRDNVRIYDPVAGTWSILAHGMPDITIGWPQLITPDPLNVNGYFIWTNASEVSHTTNGSTFVHTGMGNGSVDANGNYVSTFVRCAPTKRPAVALRYRFGGQCFALSDPIIVLDPVTGAAGARMVAHTGLGPLETMVPAWPTQNYLSGDNPLDPAKAPLWREITAGAEAKVGQIPLWLGDKLWNGAQDISVSLAEDGRRGHTAAVYTFPPSGGLSDSVDMARGHVPNFGVSYRQRLGGGAVQGVAYTTDNIEWHLAPHQSEPGEAAYEPGAIACGANYSAVILPGWSQRSYLGHVPVVWADIRSSVPVPITFKKEDGTVVPMAFNQDKDDTSHPMSYNGFHGAYFSNPSRKVAIDPDNPHLYYFRNVGGATNVDRDNPNGPTSWVADPADYGGIYRMDVNDTSYTATRVYSAKAETGFGNPQRNGNFGMFDASILIAGGFMVLTNNLLWAGGAAEDQRLVVLNMTTWERRVINTGPGNFACISLGDPLYGTMPCLWGLAWKDNVFGLWCCHNWHTTSPTWDGPFNAVMPTGGHPGRLDARLAVGNEPKRWGDVAFSLRTRGLVSGRVQLGPVV